MTPVIYSIGVSSMHSFLYLNHSNTIKHQSGFTNKRIDKNEKQSTTDIRNTVMVKNLDENVKM